MERRVYFGLFGGRPAKSELAQQVAALGEERDTINQVIDCMSEGLVLLGAAKKILSANRSAALALAGEERDFTGESIVALTRSAELLALVDGAFAGASGSALHAAGERVWRVFASPVQGGGGIVGVILFTLDVTREEAAARRQAEAAENAAKEIRGPLGSLVSGLERLGAESGEAAALAAEAQRLGELSDALLRLAKIGKGSEPNRVKINLYTLARGVCTSAAPTAAKQNITVTADGENLLVEGDLNLLHELVQNLVDNAVRYNRPGGKVELDVSEEAGRAVLVVRDTGTGITAEHLPYVFERFYRGQRGGKREGAGLGLPLVKQIAEYYGGSVALESEEGKGTTVTVSLPILGGEK